MHNDQPMTSRARFFAALQGTSLDRVPVFPLLMFLAIDRAGINYREFATNGLALADAQLQAQQRFGFDAVTACSDAFRISADLGGEMAFPLNNPPYLTQPLVTTLADVDRLGHPDPTCGRMGDRVRAVEAMVRGANGSVAVLGWVDMPFAEACSLCGVTEMMLLLVDEPLLAHRLLDELTIRIIGFALAQVSVGADMIGAGDAAASLLSTAMFREFALPYEQRVCNAIHQANCLVKLHMCGDSRHLLEDLATCGADLFNVDHMVPLEEAKRVYTTHGKAYKGNMNPVADIMQATPDACRQQALRCLSIAEGSRYMLSGGCEIPAETPDDVFHAFCEAPQLYAGRSVAPDVV